MCGTTHVCGRDKLVFEYDSQSGVNIVVIVFQLHEKVSWFWSATFGLDQFKSGLIDLDGSRSSYNSSCAHVLIKISVRRGRLLSWPDIICKTGPYVLPTDNHNIIVTCFSIGANVSEQVVEDKGWVTNLTNNENNVGVFFFRTAYLGRFSWGSKY